MKPCPFCAIVAGEAPATVLREWADAICIEPLNPVVRGHVLVIPKVHVQTFFSSPAVSAATMGRAAEMLHGVEWHHEPRDHNVITSAGRAATQTVDHLHIHIVPREPGDGLPLPWTPQTTRVRREGNLMTDRQYHAFLNLLMSSDPTPVSEEDDAVLRELADTEAAARGFATWIEAFHA